MAGDQADVALPLAQGRQVDGNHVQAIVQILAEPPGRHLGQRIAVGGGDEADVHLLHLRAAHRLEGAGLDEAQDLGLQLHRHLAHLVQEQGAAVGLARGARAVADRPGEGALHMAEDLTFQQVLGDGGAVDGDEGMIAAGAAAVDGIGRQLLARAALAREEDAGPAGRHAFDQAIDRLHGGGGADEGMKAAPVQLPPVMGDDAGQAPPLQGVAHGDDQAGGGEGLHQEIEGAIAHGLHRHADGAVGRHHDDRQVGVALPGGAQHLQPIDVRQLQVQHQGARLSQAQAFQRLGARLLVLHLVPLAMQVFGVDPGQGGGVLDEQHPVEIRLGHGPIWCSGWMPGAKDRCATQAPGIVAYSRRWRREPGRRRANSRPIQVPPSRARVSALPFQPPRNDCTICFRINVPRGWFHACLPSRAPRVRRCHRRPCRKRP
ncbi:hypothetical protein AZA_55281 [Nitrospirillum viridazoti Y2]|nr:hypothetical protein AZA_55281 [Nitrospirillum amazonense Y2]